MSDFFEMVVIPIAILFIIIGIAMSLFNMAVINPQNEIWTNWSNLCREQGGIVQEVNPSQSECFKNGKIILHIN